jgi:hypothetical protein
MGKRGPSRMIEWGDVTMEKESSGTTKKASSHIRKEYHRTRARNLKSDVKGAVVHDRGGANVHEKGVIA